METTTPHLNSIGKPTMPNEEHFLKGKRTISASGEGSQPMQCNINIYL